MRFAKEGLREKVVSEPDNNRTLLGKGCKAAAIDSGLNVAVADPLEVDHRRRDIPMAHPLLKRADVDSVL